MSQEQPQQSKKIIIDEDWKSRVQAEKEIAEQEAGKTQSQPEEKPTETAVRDVPLPPASLEILIGSLATQTMVSLGVLPNPLTNKPERLLHQAKHLVDMLAVVQEKTEGNRTSDESRLLEDTLHQLRMAYVALSQTAENQ